MRIDKFRRYSGVGDATSKPQCGPPGEGFRLTDDCNFNVRNKRLCNVDEPMLENDAINRKYLKINSITLLNDCFGVEIKKFVIYPIL